MKLVVDLSKPEGEREQYIPLTAKEIEQQKIDLEKYLAEKDVQEKAQAELEANKAAAKEKLAALGLTPEEIAAITGA